MSNTPFFVQGKIDKDSDVYVVARTVVTGGSTGNLSPNIFNPATNVENSSVMWSVMGVQESYTPFDNVIPHSYYHYDGTSYYYPLKVLADNTNTTGYDIDITTGGITSQTNNSDYILYGAPDISTITFLSPPDKTYLSSETLVNLPLAYTDPTNDAGLYTYPVYLNKGTGSNNKILTTESGSNRQAFTTNSTKNDVGAPTEGPEIVFYNPYQSIMDNLFTLKQSLNSNQGISLTMSSAPRATSVKKYKNITVNGEGFLTPSRTGDSDFLTLSVKDVNVDTTNIYAGVGYTLNPTKNPNLQMKIKSVRGISNPTRTPLLHHAGIEYSDSTPNPHAFMAGDNPLNKNVSYEQLSEVSENTTFYFIPHHMYQVSTNMRLEYTGYTPIDMLTAYIYNVRPKILHGPLASENSVNYYKWATTAGFSTDNSELSFTTTSHDAHVGVVRRYCKTGEFCGDCYGSCDPKNAAQLGKICILDTESKTHDHPFTCDHDRHMDSSKYVSKGMIGNHSNSFIIIILIIAVIIGGGVLLFEERKMFLKHVVSSKNGHH